MSSRHIFLRNDGKISQSRVSVENCPSPDLILEKKKLNPDPKKTRTEQTEEPAQGKLSLFRFYFNMVKIFIAVSL